MSRDDALAFMRELNALTEKYHCQIVMVKHALLEIDSTYGGQGLVDIAGDKNGPNRYMFSAPWGG